MPAHRKARAERAQLALLRLDHERARGAAAIGAGADQDFAAHQAQAPFGGIEAHVDGAIGVQRQAAAVDQRDRAPFADGAAFIGQPLAPRRALHGQPGAAAAE